MRYRILCIFVMALLIASTTSMSVNVSKDSSVKIEDNNDIVTKLDVSFKCLSMKGEKIEYSNNHAFNLGSLDSNLAFGGPEDQITPAIVKTELGITLAAIYDEAIENISLYISDDDGQTWNNLVNSSVPSTYPAGDIWEGNRLFGTSVTDSNNYEGGIVTVNDYDDILDPLSWKFYSWIFPYDLGWHSMIDAKLACDNSEDTWEWGVSAYIMSTSYEGGYTDGPTVFFADPDKEGYATIGWPDYGFNGSAHCDIIIDHVTHLVYAVYDYYNTSSSKWELLIFKLDFKDIDNVDIWETFVIKGEGNLQKPEVWAYDDNLVILAETDENGNKDIICYYSDDGVNDLQKGFVVKSSKDEICPNIGMEYSAVDKMVASFIMDGNIYSSWSMDGGEKWTEPWQINDNDGLVVEEYRSSSLGYGIFAIWEEKHDDIDVYFGEVTVPPDTPTINGKTKGKAGEQYEYTISTTHPDGYDVLYYIDWGDDTYEDWIGPTPSGEPIKVEHIWANEDTYDIRVKAKTENGVEGQWATLSVSMPKNKAIKINTLIQRFLENHHNILDILKNLWGS